MHKSQYTKKYRVGFLREYHITTDYLATLNNSEYLKYSRNGAQKHDFESQKQYLEQFDFVTKYILAVTPYKNSELVATATFILDTTTKTLNVGFLIMYKYAKRGMGYEICESVVNFIELLFPNYSIEIGTLRENLSMRKIATKMKFEVDYIKTSTSRIYYNKKPYLYFDFIPNSGNELLVVANDAGGAAQIAALLKLENLKPKALLSGPAMEIFRDYQVDYSIFDLKQDIKNLKLILTGTGHYGGPESRILEQNVFEGIPIYALLDHWINYKERFHPSGNLLPKAVLTCNQISHVIASEVLQNVPVFRIPDFNLSLISRKYFNLDIAKDTLLVILEPDSPLETKNEFRIGSLEERILTIARLARERNLHKIIFRPHPSQKIENLTDMKVNWNHLENKFVNFEISKNRLLVEDLASAEVVVGFNSYALYVSQKLDIATYCFFTGAQGHWTNYFPSILSVDDI